MPRISMALVFNSILMPKHPCPNFPPALDHPRNFHQGQPNQLEHETNLILRLKFGEAIPQDDYFLPRATIKDVLLCLRIDLCGKSQLSLVGTGTTVTCSSSFRASKQISAFTGTAQPISNHKTYRTCDKVQ